MAIVVERARALGGEGAVYTFEPHPRKVLRSEQAPRLLNTLEQKLELIEETGIDLVVVEAFDARLAKMPAESFVRDVLHRRLGPREVYVGYDFRYGRDREGSMRTLTELGPHLGFSVTIVSEVTVGDRDVNSTRIRELLAAGEVEEAGTLLGRPYRIWGAVVEGDRRGRALGFPTANLLPENEVLPAQGVYAGHVRLLDRATRDLDESYLAVTNVGRRPTFEPSDTVLAETHLIGFDGDLYGLRVELTFEHHLRAERRFDEVSELKRQIEADRDEAKRRLTAR